jgi:hypothetical protein
MSLELFFAAASVGVAVLALIASSILLARQARHMEHERNALALLEAVNRLSDPIVLEVFARLAGVDARYPTDDDFRRNFPGSKDDRDMSLVGLYVETVAVLARRRVIDPSLLVDAVGLGLRRRWAAIRTFILRRRRLENNPYIMENFEWLAMYSAWWKDVPRPKRDPNYDPAQFAHVAFSA